MQPVDTSGMFSQIAQQGALFAFMLLVILALAWAIKTLYSRNVTLGDMYHQAMIDTSTAMNKAADASDSIAHQMEIMNRAR
jgi:hypothetical protein